MNTIDASISQMNTVFENVASSLSNVKSANNNHTTMVKQDSTANNYAPLWTAYNP